DIFLVLVKKQPADTSDIVHYTPSNTRNEAAECDSTGFLEAIVLHFAVFGGFTGVCARIRLHPLL
ncbi:MAG: hypothetical protein R3254_06890, partial [Thiomicrorhabdus sp.]|nr:hypothetical protein [Thiomicrorhabdus sp.]